jgi:carbon-monoxide dehydrogenase small subunit
MQYVTLVVNGRRVTAEIDERTLLLDFVRSVAGLTGTKNGCLEARCGCCSVHLDGQVVKSCNVLAVQCDGANVTTVEGLAEPVIAAEEEQTALGGAPEVRLNALQMAFHEHGALQCGFCTPGMLMAITDFLDRTKNPSEDDVRRGITGNLCRCTGYQKIIDATLDAAQRLRP